MQWWIMDMAGEVLRDQVLAWIDAHGHPETADQMAQMSDRVGQSAWETAGFSGSPDAYREASVRYSAQVADLYAWSRVGGDTGAQIGNGVLIGEYLTGCGDPESLRVSAAGRAAAEGYLHGRGWSEPSIPRADRPITEQGKTSLKDRLKAKLGQPAGKADDSAQWAREPAADHQVSPFGDTGPGGARVAKIDHARQYYRQRDGQAEAQTGTQTPPSLSQMLGRHAEQEARNSGPAGAGEGLSL